MEYLLLQKIVAELSDRICPSKVAKVHQPDADMLILRLWTGRETLRLLLSAEPGHSRIHLSEQEFLNPQRPPRFCQLLRARLARIEAITLVDNDRIVFIQGSGVSGPCRLIMELTGGSSNLILCGPDGMIIDALRRSPAAGSGRAIMAGQPYQLPPRRSQDKDKAGNIEDELETGQSFNQYAARRYDGTGDSEGREVRQDIHEQLLKTVQRQRKKLEKRLQNIRADFAKQQNPDSYKIQGELLLANLYRLKRGMDQVVLDDYYHDPPQSITITLDPKLEPQSNAESFFRTYKKLRRGFEHTRRRLEETETELSWLEDLEYQLKESVSKSDLEDIAQELKDAGQFKESGNLHARRTTVASVPRQLTSPGGYDIRWGRNNRQNDEVSTRILKKGDLWFHAHHIPGAHVVLKVGEKNALVPEADLLYAASLAAGYSKARNDSKVEVMMAEAGQVKKPPGARPGQVFVKQFKTLLVEPLRVD